MEPVVDLRSDTVTRPTAAMRNAMAAAPVGDDVLGDDPGVHHLQQQAAELLGFEASLFFPSGTQANLAAMMCHCGRGDEVILGDCSHMYRYEGGGGAVLGSIQPQPLPNDADGTIDAAAIEAAIKADDPHFPRTRLIALENTWWGRPLPASYTRQVLMLALRRGLATHLDGARIFNAAVAQGTDARRLCTGFDSVSVCLSKGLGAPVGTLLFGARDFIREALRVRKMLGGGMRQIGMLAAAGLHALEHHVHRLEQDHENAARLASGLGNAGLQVQQHTNMVFVDLDQAALAPLTAHLERHGVRVLATTPMRLVTHLDVDAAGIERAIAAFSQFRPER